jgi:nucleotide sugar dehydrogenase
MKVVIIGYGVVGENMLELFPEADVHDPAKNMLAGKRKVEVMRLSDEQTKCYEIKPGKWYDVGFVCVPTDKLPSGSADTSIVESVVEEWSVQCDVLVIKSTVPPGTTQRLREEGYRVVMSPEYFGATAHANALDHHFVILGGAQEDCDIVAELYKEYTPATYRIYKTSATMAELVKYSENAWIATKVTFVNEMAQACEHYGLDRDEWRELWLLDERISRHHTYSYREHPYYASHCLDKDVPAMLAAAALRGLLLPLIQSVQTINHNRRYHA